MRGGSLDPTGDDRRRARFSLVALAAMFWLLAAAGDARADSPAAGDKVVQIFVMRRPLDGPVLGSVRRFRHSALLLRTDRGRYYTLEYTNDSRAHLTEGRPALFEVPAEGRAIVAMAGYVGGRTEEARWECEAAGLVVPPEWSPADLQQKMQSLMKPYSIWRREHCHTAQERLRRELRILR
jgi:hypothetical protein